MFIAVTRCSLQRVKRVRAEKVFPTFLLPCTPSAFRQMRMHPFSISTDKYLPLQNFDRYTGTSKNSYDNTFYHDYS